MKQTFYLKPVVTRLAELNDMLWFNRFSAHEIRRKLLSRAEVNPFGVLSECYARNPYSKRIDVRLTDAGECLKGHDRVMFRAVFGCSYEYLSRHREAMLELLAVAGGAPWKTIKRRKGESPEDHFERALLENACPDIGAWHKITSAYLRIRRNQYFHVVESSWGKTMDFLTAHGAGLNRFWAQKPSVNRIDFTKDGLGVVSDEEAVGLLRLMHILVMETDRHVVSLLDRKKHLSQAIVHWNKPDGVVRGTRSGVSPKARAGGMAKRARDELGIKCAREEILGLLP